MKKAITAIATAALVLTMAFPALARPPFAEAAKPGDQTIVQIASGNSDFDILVAAVVEAELADALSGNRQLTVFAPTDGAFVDTFRIVLDNPSLQESDVKAFVADGGVDETLGEGTLADILLYHVIPGRRNSRSVLAAPGYQTLNGDRLSRTELVAAGVNPADISASNGIIHILEDGVLLP